MPRKTKTEVIVFFLLISNALSK